MICKLFISFQKFMLQNYNQMIPISNTIKMVNWYH